MSMMVKHLVSVLCKWLVIRSNAAVYLYKELGMKDLASSVTTVSGGEAVSQPPTCLFQMGKSRKPLYHFFFFFLSHDTYLLSFGFSFFVPFPFALFPNTSMGGHSVPHRADSCSPVLSGLKQI